MYRGMGSIEAMKSGSKDRYFQDVEDDIKKLVRRGLKGGSRTRAVSTRQCTRWWEASGQPWDTADAGRSPS